MTLTVSDFAKLCRCCLESVVPLQSIFDCSLVMMFRDIVRIEMEENDGFPQKICHRCTLKLSSAFNYRTMTIRNYRTLCDVLNKSKDSIQMEDAHINEESNYMDNLNSETLTENDKINLIEIKHIKTENNIKSAMKQENDIGYVILEKEIQNHIENDEGLIYETFETDLIDNDKAECENDSSETYVDNVCSEEEGKLISLHSRNLILDEKNLESHMETESFGECNNVTLEGSLKQIDGHSQIELKTNCDKTSGDKLSKPSHLCSHCGKIFKWKTSLYKHLRSQMNVLDHDVHTKSVVNKTELRSVSDPVPKIIHKCETCDATFKSARALKNHEKIHTTRTRYNCVQCLATFYHKHSLQRHCQRKHSLMQEEHICDHCNKKFLSVKSLKNHLRVHKVEIVESDSLQIVSNDNSVLASGLNIISMEYICMVCRTNFDSQSELELHKCGQQSYQPVGDVNILVFPRHSQNKVFCEICRCVCNNMDELKTHFQTVHNMRHLKWLTL